MNKLKIAKIFLISFLTLNGLAILIYMSALLFAQNTATSTTLLTALTAWHLLGELGAFITLQVVMNVKKHGHSQD